MRFGHLNLRWKTSPEFRMAYILLTYWLIFFMRTQQNYRTFRKSDGWSTFHVTIHCHSYPFLLRLLWEIFERKVYRRILDPVYDNEKENWRILTNKEIYASVKKTYYNRDNKVIKYLRVFKHVSDHRGSIIRKPCTVLGSKLQEWFPLTFQRIHRIILVMILSYPLTCQWTW